MDNNELYILACSLRHAEKTERNMRAHNKELYEFINSLYPEYPNITFAERFYWFTHNLTSLPVCKNCGGPVKFIDGRDGYREYCCVKCSNNHNDKKKKAINTNIERYGVQNIQQIKEVNQKGIQTKKEKYGSGNNKEQILRTKKERYGDENYNNLEKIKETKQERYNDPYYTNPDKIRESLYIRHVNIILPRYNDLEISKYGSVGVDPIEKVKITKKRRYGDENYNNSDKMKSTKKERYGDENYNNSDKMKSTKKERYGDENYNNPVQASKTRRKNNIDNSDFIIGYDIDGRWICTCPHPGCTKCERKTFNIFGNMYHDRKRDGTEICTNILPESTTGKNTTLEIFVKNILDGHNIFYICNDRTILNNKELDIYIPDKKLAIECNGIFWHSSNFRKDNSHKHADKYKLCEEKGIQLLTIWEDQIINQPDIVESIILSKLGIYNTRIYARKCVIKVVETKEAINFLKANHIQGKTSSTIKLGLYYNDELVSLMTFGMQKRCSGGSKNSNWELNRFCNKINTQVVGAASRLLSYFIKEYKPSCIVSYSSNDISNGSLYKILGFKSDGKITNAYWYIQHRTLNRYHRTNFSKSRLKSMGVEIEGKTENDIMSKLPYWKIYDSGHIKWIKKL